MLKRLAVHPSAGVAPWACDRLSEQWPLALVELADETSAHESSRARITTIRTMSQHAGDLAPPFLARLIGDVHPHVRAAAGDEMIRLGEGPLRESVLRQLDRVLAEDRWQAHAQGMRVAAALKYTEAWPAAMQLMEFQHMQSRQAAAYFLGRHLPAVEMPKLWVRFEVLLELMAVNAAEGLEEEF